MRSTLAIAGLFTCTGFGPCGGNAIMATNDNNDLVGSETDSTSAESGFQPGRRKVMIAGALLVPTIVTLHGTPAWAAQTNYIVTAYRYGVNKGLCRNPNPNAPADEEFIPCKKGRGHDDPGGPAQGSGPEVF